MSVPPVMEQATAAGTAAGAKGSERAQNLKCVGEGFEALFSTTLISELLKPLQGAGLGGSGPGASIVQGLIESNLADHLARSGGLGIGRMVERALSEGNR